MIPALVSKCRSNVKCKSNINLNNSFLGNYEMCINNANVDIVTSFFLLRN